MPSSSHQQITLEKETYRHRNGKQPERTVQREVLVAPENAESKRPVLRGCWMECRWKCRRRGYARISSSCCKWVNDAGSESIANGIRQGVEGSLIRYDEGYDPLDEDQRLQGARWRVDPSLGE
jgi:hypothetical protein